MTGRAALADAILAPLAGRSDEDWHRAAPGVWSAGEIVAHLAVAMETSAKGLASRADAPTMRRRPAPPVARVAKFLVLGLGWFPVRRKAPPTAQPPAHPDRITTETRLRDAVAAFTRTAEHLLPARGTDLFLKHPVFGDLSVEEWWRFHEVHARHHIRQIRERLAR